MGNEHEMRFVGRQGDRLPISRSWETTNAAGERWTVYDFGATYPLGEIRSEPGRANDPRGAEHSLDGTEWSAIPEPGPGEPIRLKSVHARYVRMEGAGAEFFAGVGFAAEPADDWTRLFHRKQGWTGADGIYSIPLNGVEAPGRAARSRTLFLFGDTFVGEVDERTDARKGATMINNSLALLEGDRPSPAAVSFRWNREGETPASAIMPRTPGGLAHGGTYYWLQDGTSVGGEFHCFPLIIGPNPDGPEGFQFEVHGVARVSAPMGEDGPMLEQQEQEDTPLYFRSSGGLTTYFGAAIQPNTAEAGVPDPDGYVYVYGLQKDEDTNLVVARVPADELARVERWTFWNGSEWTPRKEECAPIAFGVSAELSVSPAPEGFAGGKYVLVTQLGGVSGHRVAVAAGESPIGPFEPSVPVYACPEPEQGHDVYTYNAKAHPHLSHPGELLASYNVNATSMDALMAFGGIYRPKFIRIRQVV
ncbi:DUF4185 domain-containing protein [Paenibacillaceae bacterium WGS1546]|uniref:DUF4185 domain-containing protein n=1 Tax=Cohnella sp. WGS1546 TaxID=3366810 RepID=UPI00372D444E